MGRKGEEGRREEGKKAVEEIVLAIQNGHVFFFGRGLRKVLALHAYVLVWCERCAAVVVPNQFLVFKISIHMIPAVTVQPKPLNSVT